MPKGRLQPSKAWLKEDELESLLAWENADPRERIALVVFAFRSETPLVDHKPTMSLHGVNYLLMGCRARDYFPLRRDRCVKDGWGTCDLPNRGFLRIAARAEELLG